MENRYELILSRGKVTEIKGVGGVEVQHRRDGLVVEVKQFRGVEQLVAIRVQHDQILGVPDLVRPFSPVGEDILRLVIEEEFAPLIFSKKK